MVALEIDQLEVMLGCSPEEQLIGAFFNYGTQCVAQIKSFRFDGTIIEVLVDNGYVTTPVKYGGGVTSLGRETKYMSVVEISTGLKRNNTFASPETLKSLYRWIEKFARTNGH